MKILKYVPYLVGLSQVILGALYLFMPTGFLEMQGLDPAAADTGYPLGMLAARFLVYGVGMFYIARNPAKNLFWLDGMIAIQAIDLAAGMYYTASGIVGLAVSGVAMFDAVLFIVLLGAYRMIVQRSARKNIAPAIA